MNSAVYIGILESCLRPCTSANLQPNGWKEKYQGVSSDL